MVYDFHLAPAPGNSGSGNLGSAYEVSLEKDQNEKPYLLVALQGNGRPLGTWSEKEYNLLKENLKQVGFEYDVDRLPIKWTSPDEQIPLDEDGGFREPPSDD